MSRNCAHCATPLEENALYCGTCGTLNEKQKACVQCGVMLDAGLNFCTACGTPVSGSKGSDVLASNAASTAPLTKPEPDEPAEDIFAGLSVNTTIGAPVESSGQAAPSPDASVFAVADTAPMAQSIIVSAAASAHPNAQIPNNQPVATATQSPWQSLGQAPGEPQQDKLFGKPAIIAIIVAAVLLVGAGIALAVTQPWVAPPEPAVVQPVDEDEESEATQATEEDVEETDTSEQAAAESEQLGETQVYTELTKYYSFLAGFEERVKECATEFNGAYSSSDESTRAARAEKAEALLKELTTHYDQLKRLGVPLVSANYQSYDNICTLYNALIQRTSVLCEAWKISLSYSTPADHTSEILAPIGKDNVGGVNKYKTEYERLYPYSAPKQPQVG